MNQNGRIEFQIAPKFRI